MHDDALKAILLKVARREDGKLRLTCQQAFRLTAEHDVALHDIGRICNREKVAICKCQLGCFR